MCERAYVCVCMCVCVSVTHHRHSFIGVHAEGGPGGAGHPGDGVEGFTDVDVEVRDAVFLILGQLVIWGHATQKRDEVKYALQQ